MSTEDGEVILSQLRDEGEKKEGAVDEGVFELADSDSSDEEKPKPSAAKVNRASWKDTFGGLKQMVEKFEVLPMSRRSQIPKISDEPKKDDEQIQVKMYEYSAQQFKEAQVSYSNIPAKASPWATVRWIDIEGFNSKMLRHLRKKFRLNPLAVEDVAEIPQRPRFQFYPASVAEENQGHIFLIFQMISAQFEKGVSIQTEQVSMFIFENTIVTIQEGKTGDVWEEVRDNLNNADSRLRKENIEFLIYSLLDSIIDILQDTISKFGTLLEDVEQELFDDPLDERKYAMCRSVNRDLLLIRRLSGPMVQMVEKMIAPMEQGRWNLKEDATKQYHFSQQTRDYLRDVNENLARIVDLLATYKEICVSLDNLHTSAQEHRMNRTMYTLAVVSTIFLPLTFAAGVYGMNFKENFPEIGWKYGYLYWWCLVLVMVTITVLILRYIIKAKIE